MTEQLPPSPWGNQDGYSGVRPWVNNHLKACKDPDHTGLCNIREQYQIRKPATGKEKQTERA